MPFDLTELNIECLQLRRDARNKDLILDWISVEANEVVRFPMLAFAHRFRFALPFL
jgi:hypothetical protein